MTYSLLFFILVGAILNMYIAYDTIKVLMNSTIPHISSRLGCSACQKNGHIHKKRTKNITLLLKQSGNKNENHLLNKVWYNYVCNNYKQYGIAQHTYGRKI